MLEDDIKYKKFLKNIDINDFFMKSAVHKGITGIVDKDYELQKDLMWESLFDFSFSVRNLYIFVIIGVDERTFRDVAEEMKLSETRIRQIFYDMLKKFKHPKIKQLVYVNI